MAGQGGLQALLTLQPPQELLVLLLGLKGVEDICLGTQETVDLVTLGLLVQLPLLVHKLDLIIRLR